jgi:hypothetical protein
MKLEVGQFVRTKDGIIGKYFGEKAYEPNKICIWTETTKEGIQITPIIDKDTIVKASYSIIDILEVGDVIIDREGHKYPINYEFETDYNSEYKSYEITIDDHITLFLKDGLSIITKEQFEQMSYKVGEKDNNKR